MFKFLGILAAMMFSAPTNGAPAGPIRLVTEPAGDGVRIQVVGSADTPYEASYSLEAESGPQGGSNRSVTRSWVRLEPGVAVTLATVNLGNAGKWTARLKVEPKDAPAYEEVRTSS
jgi:hypothetical protein